jgi:general secretion pathway protein G
MYPTDPPCTMFLRSFCAHRDARDRLRQPLRARRARGFTVIEMMLTVAIAAVLTAVAVGGYGRYKERVQMAQAIFDIASLEPLISRYELDHRELPAGLADIGKAYMKDPWGTPYQYISHDDKKGKDGWRKDHNIVPINSDYDLWSNGKDGKSSPPLTAKASRDDIVRASNGRFIGAASELDP